VYAAVPLLALTELPGHFAWCVVSLVGNQANLSMLFNRSGMLLFFTAFSMIILFWAKNYNKQFDADKAKRSSERLKWVFIGVNLLMYALSFSFMVAFWFEVCSPLPENVVVRLLTFS
jgi:hypothetical protein